MKVEHSWFERESLLVEQLLFNANEATCRASCKLKYSSVFTLNFEQLFIGTKIQKSLE